MTSEDATLQQESRTGAVEPRWIELAGADNVRDVAGLPTADGRTIAAGRLIRSDNLQELTPADVRHLVDDLHVRAVADLRTGVEVRGEGPGPLSREPSVDIHHLSLYPEAGERTDAAAAEDGPEGQPADAPVILPWQTRPGPGANGASNADTDVDGADEGDERRRGASAVYLRYLDDRADSVLSTLRLIAGTDGATIVHCAAGKDRTGTVVALALAEVGVTREAIVADYAHSAERVERIFARLGRRKTYADDIGHKSVDVDRHKPRAVTMERLFDALDDIHGGAPAWLRAHGWTDADAAALRHKLLD